MSSSAINSTSLNKKFTVNRPEFRNTVWSNLWSNIYTWLTPDSFYHNHPLVFPPNRTKNIVMVYMLKKRPHETAMFSHYCLYPSNAFNERRVNIPYTIGRTFVASGHSIQVFFFFHLKPLSLYKTCLCTFFSVAGNWFLIPKFPTAIKYHMTPNSRV